MGKHLRISRRAALKGLGVCVALPWLEAMLPRTAFGAPAATPGATIDRLSAAMVAAVRDPAVGERLRAFGLEPTGTTAAALAAIQKADSDRWAVAVKLSGFTATE